MHRHRLKGKSLFPGARKRKVHLVPPEADKMLARVSRSMRCSESNVVSYLALSFGPDVIKSGVRRDPATGQLVEGADHA